MLGRFGQLSTNLVTGFEKPLLVQEEGAGISVVPPHVHICIITPILYLPNSRSPSHRPVKTANAFGRPRVCFRGIHLFGSYVDGIYDGLGETIQPSSRFDVFKLH